MQGVVDVDWDWNNRREFSQVVRSKGESDPPRVCVPSWISVSGAMLMRGGVSSSFVMVIAARV